MKNPIAATDFGIEAIATLLRQDDRRFKKSLSMTHREFLYLQNKVGATGRQGLCDHGQRQHVEGIEFIGI